MTQRLATVALLGLALVATACGKKEEPVVQPPPVPTTPRINQDSINAANARRADSIRAAEAAARAAAAAAAAAAEAARAALVKEVAMSIHFAYDQYAVEAGDQANLTRKAAIMRANSALRIRVVGHADERGSDEYNLALGMRRATAAKDFLVGQGIDASRIDVASLGEEVPMDPASNETAWAANRRAEFEIIAGGQTLVAPRN
ncbi:MAG: peptidoglycan-associated lipoprotein [Gemmatimonadetes bacterium HGW-Gemmatimonadetes-1]|jgi:peptidoglycan-associated lipoprotein|nr:MAG: peptidoglycan-associated lipoprotein [Gemmatimonadetes bacterium HGW-Gemmatimonadetes-1]